MESMGMIIRMWMWSVGGVVRRYIEFLVLLIPTLLVLALFAAASLYFYIHFFVFHFCLCYFCVI